MSVSDIQGLLERALAGGVAPGLSAAITLPDGSTQAFVAGACGVADPAPIAPDTVFWIASCTKALVSAAALELVAQGRLDLDAPIGELLPHFADLQVLEGFDAAGAPRLRPPRTAVTLRMLLSHTSGLAYDFNSAETLQYLGAKGLSLVTAGAHGFPLVFEPGEDWRYGVGIDAAGQLVEAAAGVPLAEHMQATIFGPLGMADTTFDPTADQNARRAGLHARLPDGAFVPLDPIPPMPPGLRGGGGLVSTPTDYLRFLRAILDGGAGIFSPATLAHLATPHVTGPTVGDLESVIPQMSHDFRILPGMEKGWTLGFLQNLADLPGARRAGSLAWAGIANCYYWADPQSGVAGALFAQVLPFADPRILETFDAMERAAYAA
ncbi:serine hydrolase domain-containing protein [Phenylobacterium kunshanense]|uniref:1,4-butanediol diacrylate esterase n=1 Tax=Phenylobacterium kunshanense TaxID=1445034 RepID=A0A328BGK9_9CAUL|nr:serine hydrolase domain-containing protein [Phenylobacterium kunshanense]RAK65014.1 1,4-butanediol diacrylate esterase [Phenylobacterium kunshanense]